MFVSWAFSALITIFVDRETPCMVFHIEVAAGNRMNGIRHLKRRLGAVARQHEIGHVKRSFRPAQVGPLLNLGQERTIEVGGDPVGEKQLRRKIDGDGRGAIRVAMFRQHVTSHLLGQSPVHDPKREADVVPTQVAQATQWFKLAVGANVVGKEVLTGPKRKVRSNSLQRTDGLPIVKDLADFLQPPAVHEHHSVHKLHAAVAACRQDLAHVLRSGPDRFLHQHVFARFRRANDPRFANPRRQREVHGVDHVARQQRFIAAASPRWRSERGMPLALVNELSAALEIAAGDGRQLAVRGVANGLPVLAGDIRGAADAPAADILVHVALPYVTTSRRRLR